MKISNHRIIFQKNLLRTGEDLEAAELKNLNLNKVKGKMEHTLDEVPCHFIYFQQKKIKITVNWTIGI